MGAPFYALCNIKLLGKIVDYDGYIHYLRQWRQKLEVHSIITVYRSANMMQDVYVINFVDIWSLGSVSNVERYSCLLNAMYDMTQFVVVQGSKITESSYFDRLFMEGFLLKFGLCLLVVSNANIFFAKCLRKCVRRLTCAST